MTPAEYLTKTGFNTVEYARQKATNSWDLKKFYGFDADAGELGRYELSRKAQDILGAVMLGFLPVLRKKTGYDAMRLDGNTFVGVELKSSYTDETKFIRTQQGTIYSATQSRIVNGEVDRNCATSLKSTYNATYNIIENLGVKNIDTYLLIVDSRTDDVIDCYLIRGEDMEVYLNGRVIPPSGAVKIKLSTFARLGVRYTDTIIPVIGLDVWVEALLPTLPLVRVVSKPQSKSIS